MCITQIKTNSIDSSFVRGAGERKREGGRGREREEGRERKREREEFKPVLFWLLKLVTTGDSLWHLEAKHLHIEVYALFNNYLVG